MDCALRIEDFLGISDPNVYDRLVGQGKCKFCSYLVTSHTRFTDKRLLADFIGVFRDYVALEREKTREQMRQRMSRSTSEDTKNTMDSNDDVSGIE